MGWDAPNGTYYVGDSLYLKIIARNQYGNPSETYNRKVVVTHDCLATGALEPEPWQSSEGDFTLWMVDGVAYNPRNPDVPIIFFKEGEVTITVRSTVNHSINGNIIINVATQRRRNGESILKNADFESGVGDTPDFWTHSAWRPSDATFLWENGTGRGGSNCISITVNEDTPNDAHWKQQVQLIPNEWYNLHGWIKGENITKTEGGGTGANLCLLGTWTSTGAGGSLGTFSWKEVVFTFQAPASGVAEIGCRLGYWGSEITGKVWFDDLRLTSDDFVKHEGKHVCLVLESQDLSAITEANMTRWVEHLDQAYEAYTDLVGGVPYDGEKINIVSVRQYPGGWAVAGNPIKWQQRYVKDQLKWVNDVDDWSFGIMHELGHDFDLDYTWVWEAEFMANFKMYYVAQTLNATVRQGGELNDPLGLKNYYQSRYDKARERSEFNFDCQVLRFIEISGKITWGPFEQTFRAFNTLDTFFPDELPETRFGKFTLFIDKLTDFSGTDVWNLFTVEELDWIKRELDGDVPLPDAGQDTDICQGENFIFNGSGSTDNVGIVNYTWTFSYDNSDIFLYGIAQYFVFDITGKYSITLNTTDVGGNWATDVMVLTVKESGLPIARVGEDIIVIQNETVFFDGSSSVSTT